MKEIHNHNSDKIMTTMIIMLHRFFSSINPLFKNHQTEFCFWFQKNVRPNAFHVWFVYLCTNAKHSSNISIPIYRWYKWLQKGMQINRMGTKTRYVYVKLGYFDISSIIWFYVSINFLFRLCCLQRYCVPRKSEVPSEQRSC